MIGYLNSFDDNKSTMLSLVDDKELLKKYTEVWKKIEDLIGKKFNSNVILSSNNNNDDGNDDDDDNDDKYIKTKIKSYLDNIKTNFYDKNDNKKPPKKVGHISVSY